MDTFFLPRDPAGPPPLLPPGFLHARWLQQPNDSDMVPTASPIRARNTLPEDAAESGGRLPRLACPPVVPIPVGRHHLASSRDRARSRSRSRRVLIRKTRAVANAAEK